MLRGICRLYNPCMVVIPYPLGNETENFALPVIASEAPATSEAWWSGSS